MKTFIYFLYLINVEKSILKMETPSPTIKAHYIQIIRWNRFNSLYDLVPENSNYFIAA